MTESKSKVEEVARAMCLNDPKFACDGCPDGCEAPPDFLIEEGYFDKARAAIKAHRVPTPDMIEAAVRKLGWWVEAYEAPREGGVPTECDLSQADADEINRQQMAAFKEGFQAAIDAALNEGGE